MKKILCLLVAMLLMFSCVAPVTAADTIKVKLGGELIRFDVQPQLINDRTMVPLRAIFEALGATVEWNGETQTVTSTKDDVTIQLTINNPIMYVNGEAVTLDSPACLVENRTLVPVRAISEAFNLKVEWVDATKTVKIKTKVAVLSQFVDNYHDYKNTYAYDTNGNLIFETSTLTWIKYTYDENDNLLQWSQGGDVWEKYEYDEDGNRVFAENSDGEQIQYIYNDKGQLIREENSALGRTEYTYNENGQLILKATAYDYWERYEYDENGRLTLEGSELGETTYIYDESGKLIFGQYTYPGLETKCEYEYIYDTEGFLSKRIYSEDGIARCIETYTVIEK